MAGNKKPQKPQKSKTFEKESWKGSVITAPLPPVLVSCGTADKPAEEAPAACGAADAPAACGAADK